MERGPWPAGAGRQREQSGQCEAQKGCPVQERLPATGTAHTGLLLLLLHRSEQRLPPLRPPLPSPLEEVSARH